MIEEISLGSDISIPVIDGRYFCSRRDPIREAVQWYKQNQELIEKASRVTVLGLGAGFHIHFIPRDIEVCYVAQEPELISRFQQLYPDSRARKLESLEFYKKSSVIPFRPSQTGHEELYNLFLKKESLNIKIIERLFSQKSANSEVKVWKTLREFVA